MGLTILNRRYGSDLGSTISLREKGHAMQWHLRLI